MRDEPVSDEGVPGLSDCHAQAGIRPVEPDLVGAWSKHGVYLFGLRAPFSLVFLTQTLATTAGASYTLDFWLSNPIGGPGTEWLVKVGATAGTLATLMDVTNAPAFNYTHYTFTFTATTSSTILQFGFKHPPDWFYLDDVSVTQN